MNDSSVPPGPTPPQQAPSASGFFGWVRSLGVIRNDGWIGGVASGVAVRIGIDPLIVRGIFLVLALLGVPMLLAYVVGWALLPDRDGSIHLQNMFRGRFDAPMIAILIIFVINFLPVVPAVLGLALWPLGAVGGVWPYELTNGWTSGGSVVLGLALVALVVVAIIKASKNRTQREANAAATGPYPGYTQSGYPEAAAPAPGAPMPATVAAPAAFAAAPPADHTAPLVPPTSSVQDAPAGQPTSAEYEQWREQHQTWLGSHEQWRIQQADADKRAREQARAEAIARGQELSRAAAVQAKARRAANPRMSVAFVAVVVGIAVIAAACVALVAAPQGPFIAATAALLTAGVVGGISMLVAGVLRRRSGFVTFLTVSTLAVALPMGLVASPFAQGPIDGMPNSVVALGHLNIDGTTSYDRDYVQLFGSTSVSLSPLETKAEDDTERGAISIVKSTGDTSIYVADGLAIDLKAVLASGTVFLFDERGPADEREYVQRTELRGTATDAAPITEGTFARAGTDLTKVGSQRVEITQTGPVYIYFEAPISEGQQ